MTASAIFAVLAFVADIVGGARYIRDMKKSRTRPHIFSWALFSLLMFISAAILFSQQAFIAAALLALEGAINATIFSLGYKQGDHNITRSDWAALFLALSAIPAWLAAREPLIAAVAVTAISLIAAYPTYRKAWGKPKQENLFAFSLYSLAGLFRLFCVSPFTLVAALHPTTLLVQSVFLSALISLRRRVLAEAKGG